MNKSLKLYASKDFNLVVCAKTAGIKIEASEQNSNGQYIWYLERSNLLDRVLKSYFTGTLTLPVQQLFFNQKLIKSQINSKNNYA